MPIHDRTRRRAGRAIAAAVLALPLTLAANPHLSSFDDARRTSIDYDRPAVAQPALDCTTSALSAVPGATILGVNSVPAGADHPAYCEVRGLIPSEIQYIVYLPHAWNGRLYMHGNGGFAGESLDAPLGHRARMKAVRLGFAATFTNTGHDAASAPAGQWANDALASEVDFGFRAVHLTVTTVKGLLASYYGRGVSRSYFDGCSTGGRQGLMSAQRFPEDFDGILAGAPVLDMTHMLWKYWQTQKAVADAPLSADTLKRLTAFLLERYDSVDGLADGVIADPLAIDFDARRDLPRGARGFTESEISTLSEIYAAVTIGDKEVFPGLVIGSERPGQSYSPETGLPLPPQSPWLTRVIPDAQGTLGQRKLVETWFRYLAFTPDDPALDWRSLDPERDLPRMQQAGRIMDAVDPDLTAFERRGAKIILYHGWADFGVSPLRTIQYYEALERRARGRADSFARLYMVPGMFHCEGGVDVDRFDLMTPLVGWVEQDVAPQVLSGVRVEDGEIVRTRPLCPYPLRLHYRGAGDGSLQEHFTCSAPTSRP